MNKGQYHRFVRQAVLFSLLGYSFAGLSLAYDVGRYVNLFNFFIPKYWQPNSVLFEVAVCVMAYIAILGIEFIPVLLEKFMPDGAASKNWAAKIHGFLNKILFLTVSFGVLLPTMHQSGLGGLALLFGQKLSPLWQTPFISLLFLISSIFMGLCIVVAIDVLYAKNFKDKNYLSMLNSMMKAASFVAIIYTIFRWEEIIRGGGAGKLAELSIETGFFWLEWAFIFFGLYLLKISKAKSSPKNIFMGASLLMAGGLLYRVNAYIIGFEAAPGVTYLPSVPELMISVGMFALQLIIFITIVKIFPVLSEE
jgi:Ni/Fe-hydrogenase subunit HybB-like protein